MIQQRKCQNCGHEFKPRRNVHVFCSTECYLFSYRRKKGHRIREDYKHSPYRGVRLKEGKLHKNLLKKWMAVYWDRDKKKNIYIGSYETQNQAALAYNRRIKKLYGETYRMNNIIDEYPYNIKNWDFIYKYYYDFFELNTNQLVEIYKYNSVDEFELLIKILKGDFNSENILLNKYRALAGSVLFKTSRPLKYRKRKEKIVIDDVINNAFNKLMNRIRYGVPVFNFANWFMCYCKYEFYESIKKSKYISSEDANFYKRKKKEHDEEMKLLYS